MQTSIDRGPVHDVDLSNDDVTPSSPSTEPDHVAARLIK